MKNLLLILFFFNLFASKAHGQQTAAQVKKLWNYYNRQQADSIYMLTDDTFRASISQSAFVQVLQHQLFPFGHMVGVGFLSTNEQGIDSYKATTEKGATLHLRLMAKDDGSLSLLSFSPWKEPQQQSSQTWHDNALITPLDSSVHSLAMQHLQQSGTPGISLAILKGTKVFYYNYGWARIATEQHPTPHTLYEIGSLTKTFTAYLLADAIVNNRVTPNDPITKYLPDSVASNKALKSITLQMLSNHTSGLPRLPANYASGSFNPDDPYAAYTTHHLFSYLTTATLLHAPGSSYTYSNVGAGLLGVILERIYQQPYEALLQEIIFKPYGLKESFSTAIMDTTLAAAPYGSKGSPVLYWNFKSMAGAGSIKSNTTDLVSYALQFSLKPKNAKRETDKRVDLLEKITTQPITTAVSMGWHFSEVFGTKRIMEHNGSTGGFSSYIGISAAQKLAVVVLCNSAVPPLADALGKPLLHSMIQ